MNENLNRQTDADLQCRAAELNRRVKVEYAGLRGSEVCFDDHVVFLAPETTKSGEVTAVTLGRGRRKSCKLARLRTSADGLTIPTTGCSPHHPVLDPAMGPHIFLDDIAEVVERFETGDESIVRF